MSEQFNEFGPFAVGEICRVIHSDTCPELIGSEVEIRSAPLLRGQPDGATWYGYETDIPHFAPPESYLRRRRPPAADSNERMYVQMWRDMADKAPQRVGETV
jgi:hypothetical protein